MNGMRTFNGKLHFLLISLTLLAAVARAQDPYQAPDDAWISISGEIDSVAADSLTLDYGGGYITVEMDDGDRDADAYELLKGDKVTVYGMIDDDLYERARIEASSVHVEKIDTFFYASARDEEDDSVDFYNFNRPGGEADAVITGTVTAVESDEFTLYTGSELLTIDVEEMDYNPLDEEGYQRVREGDRISVSGNLDDGFFEGRELEAQTIVTIRNRGDSREG